MAELKEVMISADAFETRAAILEDGRLAEIYIERREHRSIVGNIYLGRVKDVLPGMEAAFIDVGLPKNAFLYVEEVIMPEEESEPLISRIEQALSPGQKILVQVIKEPMGSKGARVTTELTLPGRYLVLLPYADFVGISRRLTEEARESLRSVAAELKPKGMGLIMRTAAQDAATEELQKDLAYLRDLWQSLQARISRSKPPMLIYQEVDLSLKVVRDIFSSDYRFLIVDSPEIYQRVTNFLENTNPALKERVRLHEEKLPLFDKFNINEQISAALRRRVWLRSGGYITTEHTEALTAIDVNTGKFIGKKSLEDTIFRTNLEAAEEIVHQIRLRDIGGIIVIDFIDMEREEHRQKVFSTFEKALKQDRTKTHVVEISSLGLIEMTRKNVAEGLLDFLCEPCPRCEGLGQVPSLETVTIDIMRKMKRRCLTREEEAFLFRINDKVASKIKSKRAATLKELEKETGKRIHVVADGLFPEGEFEIVAEGSKSKIEELARELRAEGPASSPRGSELRGAD
jgi:ribonuclease G